MYKRQVQCIILTDGESAPLRYSKECQRDWEHEPFMGTKYVHDRCIFRNRKTGHTYSCEGLGHWADVTDVLLQDLRQTFLTTNFIGIRVLANRDAGYFIRNYCGYSGKDFEQATASWKKTKSFSIKSSFLICKPTFGLDFFSSPIVDIVKPL